MSVRETGTDARAGLLTRKRDLYAAMRVLEQDREDGAVDEGAYRAARHRYEQEAAELLERIDRAGDQEPPGRFPRPTPLPLSWRRSHVVMLASGVVALAALAVLLIAATRPSSSTPSSLPIPAAPAGAPPRVLSAQSRVEAHPRDINALIALGNAYIQSGQPVLADGAYVAALRVSPTDAQALTLHAMLIGSAGRTRQSLDILHAVERAHPAYAQAWLLDGLLEQRLQGGRSRAVAAWRHFLALHPRGAAVAQVRRLMRAEQGSATTRGPSGR